MGNFGRFGCTKILSDMSGKGPGDADLGNMGAFDFSALQGVLNVSHFWCLTTWMCGSFELSLTWICQLIH